ncbi:MAG TPA: hypothetical protein VF453_06515 [Burkholderiaceae bacterium]
MQASQVPAFFSIPWANGAGAGYVRDIPTPSQIGSEPGAASLTDGFPPLNFLDPTTAGGVPPKGQDFNGILRWITQWIRWQQAGGFPGYDAGVSTAIGGYPAGAVLVSADGTHFWKSTVDNNTSDPDTGGANWTVVQQGSIPFADITGVPNFLLTSDFASTLAAAFTSGQSLGTSGYQKLPGGLIVQWGTYLAATTDTAYTVSLPIAFPTAHLRSFATVDTSGTVAGAWSAYATPGSLSTVLLTADVQSDSASNVPLAFLCIGK